MSIIQNIKNFNAQLAYGIVLHKDLYDRPLCRGHTIFEGESMWFSQKLNIIKLSPSFFCEIFLFKPVLVLVTSRQRKALYGYFHITKLVHAHVSTLSKFPFSNQPCIFQNKLSLLICFRKKCRLLVRHLLLKKMQSIVVKQRISNLLAAMFILYSKRLVTVKTYWGRLIFT